MPFFRLFRLLPPERPDLAGAGLCLLVSVLPERPDLVHIPLDTGKALGILGRKQEDLPLPLQLEEVLPGGVIGLRLYRTSIKGWSFSGSLR